MARPRLPLHELVTEASFRPRKHLTALREDDLAEECPFGSARPGVAEAWRELRRLQHEYRRSKSPQTRFRIATEFSQGVRKLHRALEAPASIAELRVGTSMYGADRFTRKGGALSPLQRDWLAWNEEHGFAWRYSRNLLLREEREALERAELDPPSSDETPADPPGFSEYNRRLAV